MKIFFFSRPILALLSVCAFCYAPLSAQTLDSVKTDTVRKVHENWYWMNLGGGVSFYAVNDNRSLQIAGELGLSIAYKSTLLSLQANGVLTLFNSFLLSYGGMYGWIERNNWTFSSVSVGISYVGYHWALPGMGTGYLSDYERFSTVGLIAEAQVALKAYVPGLGLKIFGNLNPARPFIVGMLVFHLGWMP